MIRRVLFLILFAVLFAAPSYAAGTATVTKTNTERGGVALYTIAWTSTAGGAVSGNSFTVRKGEIVQVKFVPNTGGTQPTDAYDVTLVDVNSIDVLGGTGADLSNSAGAVIAGMSIQMEEGDTLDLVVANAGNAKSGTVYVWIK